MSVTRREPPRLVAGALVASVLTRDAHIVHIADAYDAMTSARAYRPGRLPHAAILELHRLVGTDFDGLSVAAPVNARPTLPTTAADFDPGACQRAGAARGDA